MELDKLVKEHKPTEDVEKEVEKSKYKLIEVGI